MSYKVMGKFDTMRKMSYAEARDLTKNNIRRELITEDIPCEFCGKMFRPIQRTQRFCGGGNRELKIRSQCSDAYWNMYRFAKMRGLEDYADIINRISVALLTEKKPERLMVDFKQNTVTDVTPV
jgi:hypothetical protein